MRIYEPRGVKRLASEPVDNAQHVCQLDQTHQTLTMAHTRARKHPYTRGSSTSDNCYQASLQRTSSAPIPTHTPLLSSRAPKLHQSTSLRPPVKADTRLEFWSSEHAEKMHSQMSILSRLAKLADSLVLEGLAPSTKNTYGAGILRFIDFCDEWSIPEDQWMPASSSLLVAFVSAHAGQYHSKTISMWLSGIRSWHVVKQAQWFGDDE